MNLKWIGAVLLPVVLFSSCKKDEGEASSGTSQMKVRMTDAPGPYDEVNVEVIGVEVHTSAQGWLQLSQVNSGVYNLLDLTNGIDTLIASGSLPSGKISQMRLILGSRNTVVINGNSFPLLTPSAQQSGLKLQIQKELLPDITYTVLLDFDASQSIVNTGSGEYILKPVIRCITDGIDGAIRGTLSPGMVASVQAIYGASIIGTFSDSTGNFTIKGLSSGTYDLRIVPPAPYNDTLIGGITVSNGQITNIGSIVLQ